MFIVDFRENSVAFQLGNTEHARNAVEALEAYNREPSHTRLYEVIDRLFRVVDADSAHSRQAVAATEALVKKVRMVEQDPYRRLYLFSSVTGIFARAHLPTPQAWINQEVEAGSVFSGPNAIPFDRQRAEEAGLRVLRRK